MTNITQNNVSDENTIISNSYIDINNLNVWYGDHQALYDVNMSIEEKKIMAFIGPSGCGKSTLLRCFNRMNDIINSFKLDGKIELGNENITTNNVNPLNIRRKVGMVFQAPNPFPMNIYDNMKLPLVENYPNLSKEKINEIIINKLQDVNLYEEVKNRLNSPALKLSGGQQQRLCIARMLTIEPELILFDEPCSSLDPISTSIIEELIVKLKKSYTIVIVTHNIEQARRIADKVSFFYQGYIVEQGSADKIFVNPQTELLESYLSGNFC